MLIIGQVNEYTPFTETGNFRLFPPPMMQIVRHVDNSTYNCDICLIFARNTDCEYSLDDLQSILEQKS